VSERQVDQETVAIIQPAKDDCRNKGTEGRRRYVATDVRWQSSEMLSVALYHIY